MHDERTVATRKFYQIADTLGAAGLLVALLVVGNLGSMPIGLQSFLMTRLTVQNVILVSVFLIWHHFVLEFAGVYRISANVGLREKVRPITISSLLASVLVIVFPLTSRTHAFTFLLAALFCVGSTAFAVTLRVLGHVIGNYRRGKQQREVIIVGSGPRALHLSRQLEQNHTRDFRIVGFVDSPNGHRVPEEIKSRMLGRLDDLDQILMQRVVDRVMIALPIKSCYDDIQSAIAVCEQAGVESEYLPAVFQLSVARAELGSMQTDAVVRLKVVTDDHRQIIKRFIDIVGSCTGLICFAPLLFLIALAIKLTSPGPVLFKQQRFGLNKRRFGMYKFRTMIPNAEAVQDSLEMRNEKTGPIFKMKQDPRVTKVGRVLRLTSLDELPQLWNVLRGDMSLVGPRPMSVRDVSRFDEPWLMRRFSVRPGLTCLWQVGGRSDTTFERWMELDLQYIDSWSLALDASILARTIPAVIRCQGAT